MLNKLFVNSLESLFHLIGQLLIQNRSNLLFQLSANLQDVVIHKVKFLLDLFTHLELCFSSLFVGIEGWVLKIVHLMSRLYLSYGGFDHGILELLGRSLVFQSFL